jgi:hypothetical protein
MTSSSEPQEDSADPTLGQMDAHVATEERDKEHSDEVVHIIYTDPGIKDWTPTH